MKPRRYRCLRRAQAHPWTWDDRGRSVVARDVEKIRGEAFVASMLYTKVMGNAHR